MLRKGQINGLFLGLVLLIEAFCVYVIASDIGRMFLFRAFGLSYHKSKENLDLLAYLTLGVFVPFVVVLQIYPKLKLRSKLLEAPLIFLITALLVVLGFGIYGTVMVPLFLHFAPPSLYGGTPNFFIPEICFDCSTDSRPGYMLYTFYILIVLLAVAICRLFFRIFGKQNP